MKIFRTTSGPFHERPYYKDREIEDICTDALREVGLLPTEPTPIRIDRFIEKRFGVVPSYEDLPDSVLGLTRFTKDGVKEVVVANALDADTSVSAQRRIRTTLAHEGGHCLLHTHLFVLATPSQNLFGDFSDPDKPKILCRDEAASGPKYSGQWWEFHANTAMGYLLLPRQLVEKAVDEFLVPIGNLGGKQIDPLRYEFALRALADTFDVNRVVARIRLESLYPTKEDRQMAL
jgi:hypothetical protein